MVYKRVPPFETRSKTMNKAQEWADQFVRNDCTLEQVNKELICCGIATSNPDLAREVRSAYTTQILRGSHLSARAKEQHKGWKRFK
jgi:hypothetical protein